MPCELFLELETKEEQFDALFMVRKMAVPEALDDGVRMCALEAIVNSVHLSVEESEEFRMLVSNVDWSLYWE